MAGAGLIVCILLLSSAVDGKRPLSDTSVFANLPLGTVRGSVCKTQRNVWQFLRIPYGIAPSGPLRFRPPLKHNIAYPSSGLNSTVPPPACPQLYRGTQGFVDGVSEDCLYAMVWTPAMAPLSPNTKLPVRVWIHGGAFRFGMASDPLFDGCNSTAKISSIQVNLQYRLGILGFLSHPATFSESNSTGNWGLMDLVLGLRWVKENIQYFGGDPNRILIFGCSSSGNAVGLLMSMPSAEGLFSAAVMGSGPPYYYKTAEQAHFLTVDVQMAVGCPISNSSADLKCLREKNYKDLIRSLPLENTLLSSFTSHHITYPVVDGTVVPTQPGDAYVNGNFNRVAQMLGFVENEGTTFVYDSAPFQSKGFITMNDIKFFIHDLLGLDPQTVLSLYSAPDSQTQGNIKKLNFDLMAAIWQDVHIVCPTYRALKAASLHGVKAYGYYYAHLCPCCNHYPDIPDIIKVGHTAELPLLFNNTIFPTCTNFTPEDAAISQLLEEIWVSFASNGVPHLPGVTWPAWHGEQELSAYIKTVRPQLRDLNLSSKCDALGDLVGWKRISGDKETTEFGSFLQKGRSIEGSTSL